MAVPTTWATTQDVLDLTGVTVTDAQVAMATAVIEMDGGARLAKLDDKYVSDRNFDWLRRAVAYQAAWMVAHPDYFTRMDLVSLAQDGPSAVFRRDSMVLAPLAKRCLGRLSWRGIRTLTPSVNRTVDRPGYRTSNAPDLPNIANVPAYTSEDYDDGLPWEGM
jgi:hypothetical protein